MKRNLLASLLLAALAAPLTHAADPDQRRVIPMTPDGRDLVLTEMRGFLAGLQQIVAALSTDDLARAAEVSRSLGTDMMGEVPPHIMQQLPLEFRQLGRSTHQDFDQIALDLDTLGDPRHAMAQLGETLNKCVACHASWRIDLVE